MMDDSTTSCQSPSESTNAFTSIECKALRVVPPEDGSGLGLAIMPDNNGRAKVDFLVPESPATVAKGLCGNPEEKIDCGDILISVNGEDMLSKEYNDVVFALHDARKEGDIDLVFCRGDELEKWPIDADEPSFCLTPLKYASNSQLLDPYERIRVSPRVSLNFDDETPDAESQLLKTSSELESEIQVSPPYSHADHMNTDTDTDTISMSEHPVEARDVHGLTTDKDNGPSEDLNMDHNTMSDIADGPNIGLIEDHDVSATQQINKSTNTSLKQEQRPTEVAETDTPLKNTSPERCLSHEDVCAVDELPSYQEAATEYTPETQNDDHDSNDDWWPTATVVATISVGLLSAVVVAKPRLAKSFGKIILGCCKNAALVGTK